MKSADLKEFYDQRYSDNYMDEWPLEKKNRVYEVIKRLNLPETGVALDYGCGNGVFTKILRDALPGWEIHGCDISSTAVENAKKRVSGCKFFLHSGDTIGNEQYDFLFTHHVLEHVVDVESIWGHIGSILKKDASCLHILPCGNSDSFEYKFCTLRTGGINKDMENRFFFEDPAHLRRLTTEHLSEYAGKHDFALVKSFYSHQHYGSINWLTLNSPRTLVEILNPLKGVNVAAVIKLSFLLAKMVSIAVLRIPANYMNYDKVQSANMSGLAKKLLMSLLPVLKSPSKCLDKYFHRKAEEEWKLRSDDPSGSEMYLCYSRES